MVPAGWMKAGSSILVCLGRSRIPPVYLACAVGEISHSCVTRADVALLGTCLLLLSSPALHPPEIHLSLSLIRLCHPPSWVYIRRC